MSGIGTHVLDTSSGRPASGVPVCLEALTDDGGWLEIARGTTDDDGRVANLLRANQALQESTYRLRFDVTRYFDSVGLPVFYPEVAVSFIVRDAHQHYHIPLLLAPFGYSTYRGS